MGDTDERQQVMLTHRLHRDGACDYQLVICCVVAERCQVERAWGEHLGVGAGHPSRRCGQAVGVEVDTERDQERGCSVLGGDQIDFAWRLDHTQRWPWHSLSLTVTIQTVDRNRRCGHDANAFAAGRAPGRKARAS